MLGSSLSLNELLVGFEDRLREQAPGKSDYELTTSLPSKSQLIFLSQWVFLRLYPENYSTDALNPLDVEISYRDLVKDGTVLSHSTNLGQNGTKMIDITFHLHRPPRFWVYVNGLRRRGTDRDLLLDGGFEGDGVPRGDKGFKGVSLVGEKSALRLGRWLSYRLTLPLTDLPSINLILANVGLILNPSPLKPSEVANPRIASAALMDRLLKDSLPFEIKYLIDGLISFGIIIHYQVKELEGIIEEFREDWNLAARIMLTMFRKTRIWDLRKAVDDVKDRILSRPFRPAQSHMVYVGKVVVTPSRILLYPPEPQTSNFVLRRFPKQTAEGRFIRVQFWDEGTRLSMGYEAKSDNLDQNEGILARFRRVMSHGLEFAGRRYFTLDFSASQARTGSFWAVNEDLASDFTRKAIRDWLGDFSEEKVVAKNGARRGQLYSTTRDVGNINRVLVIPDFQHVSYALERYKTTTYTDGVGICTQQLVTKSAMVLGFPEDIAKTTTAVQFRQGGKKGVLVAWPLPPIDILSTGSPLLFPELPWPKLGRYDMLVRWSQIKFNSAHSGLGVIKVSTFSHAYLNREVLSLLYPRGVKHSDITRLFEEQIKDVTLTEQKLVAGEGVLQYHERLFKNFKIPVNELVTAGFHHEPFVRALARLHCSRALWDLKWKARIYVEKGVTALGVVDELGVLREGEVYCRTLHNGADQNVEGKCIIFRAPTRHPGDVQIVQAVDHPALRAANLFNVIVFNRRGNRALPDKLGGGDVDGDDYTLINDPALTNIEPKDPMDYEPGVTPPKVLDKVQPKEIREFHTKYMKEDFLGAISNAHLAQSDCFGPDHPICLELSELHSVAVDFAKTGVPAELPSDLRPRQWPDFMGPRRRGGVYESQKPLGVLFRHPLLNPLPDLVPVGEVHLDPRLASIKVPTAIMQEIRKLKRAYDLELTQLMAKFEATEEEIVAGVLLELPGGMKRLDKDSKLRDPLNTAFDCIQSDYRDAVDKLVNVEPLQLESYSRKDLLAVGAYQYTYKQSVVQTDPKLRMKSFPWTLFRESLVGLVAAKAS